MGYDYLIFFFSALFAAAMTTTMFRDVSQELVDIATFQIQIGIGGMLFGVVVSVTKKGVIGFVARPPTMKDIKKAVPYIMGGFIFLSIFNRIIVELGFRTSLLVTFSADMNIALTAAVMEEALYSFGFTILFYKVLAYMAHNTIGKNEVGENVAILGAAFMVSVFFVFIHIGVYGLEREIIILLFVNRFVYSLTFMKTRNLMVPCSLHLLHNLISFF